MSMTPSRRTVEAMTLGGMALDGRSLEVRCYRCRRTRKFLASDLAEVYGAEQSPHTLFGSCSRCGAPVRVEFDFPKRGEMICRPHRVSRWAWKDKRWEPS